MKLVLLLALVITIISIIYLALINIPEKVLSHKEEEHKKIDIKGTIKAIALVPGLFALIIFNTFNNLLGGVFMALMDAYGLSLVSVQVWGLIWGILSFGFIAGGLMVAKRGLGKNPLKTLMIGNMLMWGVSILFPIQASIALLFIGALIYMMLFPFIEAAEQTILQKVVPPERQGRVFGFAQSVEQAASPITAFIIGPIAELIFIPFMTTGAGVDLLGEWFGTGTDRGIALLFTIAGLIGLIVTLVAMRSHAYKTLSKNYQTHEMGEHPFIMNKTSQTTLAE
jgi:DHA3 family multidrug efflux protein-like MFS transporter